jgi:hypothetical protein
MEIMETSKEENPVTWSMVTAAIKLSKLQLRNIVRSAAFQEPTPDSVVDDHLLIRVMLAEMLERLAFLTAEQRALILAETNYAQKTAITDMAQLAFADGRYCLWTGSFGFLDLESGDTIQQLPVPPMETISYNLNELYRRRKHQIEKRSGLHAKRQTTDGNVEEPADVRDRAADGVSG